MAKEKPPETEAAAVEGSAKPKGKFKKILILGGLGLILMAGGLAAYVFLSDDPAEIQAHASQPAPKHDHAVSMPLEPFLVNLGDRDSRRYLKLKLDLEVDSEGTAKELEKSLPRIRDALILLLSSKTYLDLSTIDGKQQLKQEIKKRITEIPGGSKVSDVFFTEFVAQ
jgi:flagellar FliL protein